MTSNEVALRTVENGQFDYGSEFSGDQKSESTCYESTLGCCGYFWGTLRAWCPCICCCAPYPYIRVLQGSVGLKERFGKFMGFLPPGLHEINPFTEQVICVDNKTEVIDMPSQIILTKDNISAKLDTVVFYRIVNTAKSQYRVKKISDAILEISYATIRLVCGEHTLQEMLESRTMIAEEIETNVFDSVKDWGVYIENVFIKDIVLSQQMQYELSLVPQTRRVAESKLIASRADVESAKLLRDAAEMLNSKAAMQIRYLDTIQLIAQGGTQKVLFLPLGAMDQKAQEKQQLPIQEEQQL